MEYTQAFYDNHLNIKTIISLTNPAGSIADGINIDILFNSDTEYHISGNTNWSILINNASYPCRLNGCEIMNADNRLANFSRIRAGSSAVNSLVTIAFNVPVIVPNPELGTLSTINCAYNHTFNLGALYNKLTIADISGKIGETQTLEINGKLPNVEYLWELVAIFGDDSYTVVHKTEIEYDMFELPTIVLKKFTTSKNVNVIYELDSWVVNNGVETYLGKDVKAILQDISDSIAPRVTLVITDSEGHSGTDQDPFIINKSSLSISVTAFTNADALLKACRVDVGGKSYARQMSTNRITIDTGILKSDISFSTTVRITAAVSDSRGFITSVYKDVVITPYTSPSIDNVHVIRCNADGSESIYGSNFKFDWDGENSYSGALSKTLRYRKLGTQSWTVVSDPSNGGVYTGIDIQYPYEIEFIINDGVSTITYATTLSSGFVIRHIRNSGKGIAYGGMCTKDEFQVYLPAVFASGVRGLLNQLPTGDGGSADTLIEPGFYYLIYGNAEGRYSDLPEQTNGWMTVTEGPSASYTFRLQEFTTVNGTKYFRTGATYNGVTTWNSWNKVTTQTYS